MTIASRKDPLLAYNFQISLSDTPATPAGTLTTIALTGANMTPAGGFQECSGLDGTLDMHEQAVGGRNDAMLRFPTRLKWSNIQLKRGIGFNDTLWKWFEGFAYGRTGRRDGVIILQNESHEPQIVWGFRRGLPAKYSGPPLNAQQSNVAIESIEIAHEGLYRIKGASPIAGAVRSLVNAFS